MKPYTIFLLFILHSISVCAHTPGGGPELRELVNAEIPRIDTWEKVDGRWEKYRKGDNNNLRLNAVMHDGHVGYVLSRYYESMHRDHHMSIGITPVFVYHNHPVFSGCILSTDQLMALKNIYADEIVMVSSVHLLTEYEAHDYDDFVQDLYAARAYPEQEFFLYFQRTKRRKKEVVRIIDTGNLDDFDKSFLELPYEDFMKLFEEMPVVAE
ncbi:MAG: hypothetical protein LUE26_08800 [Alistipes sp.]|nr:hypothetical protein [Alistipes sp.]